MPFQPGSSALVEMLVIAEGDTGEHTGARK